MVPFEKADTWQEALVRGGVSRFEGWDSDRVLVVAPDRVDSVAVVLAIEGAECISRRDDHAGILVPREAADPEQLDWLRDLHSLDFTVFSVIVVDAESQDMEKIQRILQRDGEGGAV